MIPLDYGLKHLQTQLMSILPLLPQEMAQPQFHGANLFYFLLLNMPPSSLSDLMFLESPWKSKFEQTIWVIMILI
jgi:hypothetical protein